MKIGEAQQIYRAQVKAYQDQKVTVSKQLQDVRKRMEVSVSKDDKERYASEAATLELTLDKLDEKQSEYQEYLSKLADQYCAYWNATVAEQQADAAKEYGVEMGKLLEVARRIMKGAIVPAADEKKLMEFDSDLYQTAKSIGAMVRRQKKEKYDSLWGDEEEKEYDDPQEVAENATAASQGPEIVDVADTMASVTQTVV
ncbi:MAG: hypothetical protein K2O16_11515 [Lachnospiraceae bacterium]|nr:hypothetical protein [Lachnospiraceae bacterium]